MTQSKAAGAPPLLRALNAPAERRWRKICRTAGRGLRNRSMASSDLCPQLSHDPTSMPPKTNPKLAMYRAFISLIEFLRNIEFRLAPISLGFREMQKRGGAINVAADNDLRTGAVVRNINSGRDAVFQFGHLRTKRVSVTLRSSQHKSPCSALPSGRRQRRLLYSLRHFAAHAPEFRRPRVRLGGAGRGERRRSGSRPRPRRSAPSPRARR